MGDLTNLLAARVTDGVRLAGKTPGG